MAALVLFPGFQSENISVRTGDLLPAISNSKRHQSDIGRKRYSGVRIQLRSKRQPLSVSACFKRDAPQNSTVLREKSVSVILLAGGKGRRMGGSMPKQYLPLLGQPIALYSFYTFSQHLNEVKEIVVVCDPSYQNVFFDAETNVRVNIKYSLPGKERQYSVYNGLLKTDPNSELVCIHDSARPLVTSEDIKKVLNDGRVHGAAALGVPLKATIKEVNNESFVLRTPDRKTLWEIQTPQVIKTELLWKGFEIVNRDGLEVTDDVSVVEHINHPVYVTAGSYSNIKVTTPADLLQAESLLASTSKIHKDIAISRQ